MPEQSETGAPEVIAPATVSRPATLEDYMREFEQWLNARGLQPSIVALGKKSGAICPITDFMPDTHQASFILQPVKR